MIGAIIGGVIGSALDGKFVVLYVVAGMVIGALILGLLALMPLDVWGVLGGLFEAVECCSIFAVLLLTSIVTVSIFLFSQSLVVSVFTAVSALTLLLTALSILTHLSNLPTLKRAHAARGEEERAR
jgi:hypothetical protein